MNRLLGVVLFTLIEIVTLVAWLILAGVPFKGGYAAVAILAIGLFLEHYASIQIGLGKSIFGKLE